MQKKLSLIFIHPDDVVFDETNARGHDEDDINATMASISKFGFRDPIEIKPDKTLIAGEGRTIAARRLKLKSIPALVQYGLDDRDAMGYGLANNKTAERSFWKIPQLADNLSALLEKDFDIDVLGFTDQEISGLLQDDAGILPDGFPGRIEVKKHERKPATPSGRSNIDAPVCKLGDVWALGAHKFTIHQFGNPKDLPFFDSLITQWQSYSKEDAIDLNGNTFNDRNGG